MYLFFDWVSSHWFIALLDTQKNIIARDTFKIGGNESTKTIPIIDVFLEAQSVDYRDIQNIICVVWPGSFTGIRTITLVVNTIAYTYPNIQLTAVNFFDLYTQYPIIKSSSKRDLFVKYSKNDIIHLVSNQDFESFYQAGDVYWDTDLERFSQKISLKSEIDYEVFLQDIPLDTKKKIAPLYIKKPNIS